jgi:hypothetical protein
MTAVRNAVSHSTNPILPYKIAPGV